MASIDENYGDVAIAATNESTSVAAPLLVDASTGRLLIAITVVSSTSPTLNGQAIDENRSKTAMVDNSSDIVPLLIDNRNGYLWMDVSVET